jgi:hypothetical protein
MFKRGVYAPCTLGGRNEVLFVVEGLFSLVEECDVQHLGKRPLEGSPLALHSLTWYET